MPTVSRVFTVTPPPGTVIDYLKDFSNAEEWDPGTRTCTRADSGPVTRGSTWRNVSNIFGVTAELTYVLQKLTPDTLVFVGTNRSSTSTDTITVAAEGTGSKLAYRSDVQMKGWAKLLNPVMKVAFERLADDTERQLASVLNRLDPDHV
jgi:carbon monoxide dehydrogenase subunit G